ncbi:MAG: PepSY domain-containing protein, partial [Sphingobium sp.]
VMILTGLYLWWPRGRGLAGVVWPRLGRRTFWRDIHAVTGFWVAGLALVLLTTGLPWAAAWGSAFKAVRAELGLVNGGRQDWTLGGKAADAGEHAGHGDMADMHSGHDHEAMLRMQAAGTPMQSLAGIVAKVEHERLAFPVLVTPPGAPGQFGGAPDEMAWTVRSDAQNRPLRVTIRYDMATGREVSRQDFAGKPAVDRVVGYGIAWHEGALLGWVNQLVGLATAIMLVTLVVSGFTMWRRRKPTATLGAPPPSHVPARMHGVVAITLALAMLLPLFAASLILLWLVERLVLPRLPHVSRWLGVRAA